MDLKNAVAVCLISLFSATLVVMIARALDQQAAGRIEPQLASIVEELRALRKQGGIGVAPAATATSEAAEDGLVVYYFHSNARCPTCRSIESQSYETLQAEFAAPLSRGEVTWKVLNYEQPSVGALAKKFDIQVPVVVLARMKGGEVLDWKRLDDVWALVDDKPAFRGYVRGEIRRMLTPEKANAEPAAVSADKPGSATAANPVVPAAVPADLPLPAPPVDLPLPK